MILALKKTLADEIQTLKGEIEGNVIYMGKKSLCGILMGSLGLVALMQSRVL